jgi:hypothetical protein
MSQSPNQKLDSIDPYGYHVIKAKSRAFIGTETITVGGRTFSAAHVQESSTNSYSDPSGYLSTYQDVTDFWYSSEVGFFVKWMEDSKDVYRSGTSSPIERSHSTTTVNLSLHAPR